MITRPIVSRRIRFAKVDSSCRKDRAHVDFDGGHCRCPGGLLSEQSSEDRLRMVDGGGRSNHRGRKEEVSPSYIATVVHRLCSGVLVAFLRLLLFFAGVPIKAPRMMSLRQSRPSSPDYQHADSPVLQESGRNRMFDTHGDDWKGAVGRELAICRIKLWKPQPFQRLANVFEGRVCRDERSL
jgi:hypothetical protein